MLLWITENLATIIISLALAAIVAAIIVSLVRKKKKGETTCSCGCPDCPMSDSCNEGKQ